MKQGIPSRRTRGRGNTRGRQQSNIRNQQMDSNGPAGRLRGTPQQILDRYSALARDASSSGDMVLAENLWQHAEHYARLLSASQPQQQQQSQPQQGGNGQQYGNGRDDQSDYGDQDDDGGSDSSSQQPRRNEPVEPLVLKAEPNAEPPAKKPAAPESAPQADPGEGEQPSTSPVWTKEDAQAASEEAATERPAAPRRRRRTRFPRQADGAENASSEQGSDEGNGPADDAAASSPKLALPDDPSPAALVDLLTRAEEAAPRRKRTANSDNNDS